MVKIITSSISHQDLEDKINEWDISNSHIKSISFTAIVMIERFHSDGSISNQWIDYTAIIIY
jgi:hypothetical protein